MPCDHDLHSEPTFPSVRTCAHCGERIWQEGSDPQMGFPGFRIPLPTEPRALARALVGGNIPGSWRAPDLVPLLELVAVEGLADAIGEMGRLEGADAELMRKALVGAVRIRGG